MSDAEEDDEKLSWKHFRNGTIFMCFLFGLLPIVGLAIRFATTPGFLPDPEKYEDQVTRTLDTGTIALMCVFFAFLCLAEVHMTFRFWNEIKPIERAAMLVIGSGAILIPSSELYDFFVSELGIASLFTRAIVFTTGGCLLVYAKTRA